MQATNVLAFARQQKQRFVLRFFLNCCTAEPRLDD